MGIVFWGAVLLLLHTYFLYPLTLFAWDGLRGVRRAWRYLARGARRQSEQTWLPTVSLVVPAHNEEECIAQKLQNSLDLDYPSDKLEVLVGSDGSTDGTEALVCACPDARVKLSAAPRGGKVSVLNRCIPPARGEVVVLTDANTMIDPLAVRRLVRHFEDPKVGAVCGRLKLYNRVRQEYEEGLYWRYETLLKLYEGRQGVVLGANGGLYAIRRRLFEPLCPETIVDDLVIPLRLLDAGWQVRYEPDAVAYEETVEDYGREFARRARISAGNFQSLRMVPGLLSPRRGFAAYAFWSHKVVRWCAPLLMAIALLANAALLTDGLLYQGLFGAQLAFYLVAWAGGKGVFRGALKRLSSIAYFFVFMNLALVVGFWRFLRGSQSAAWERTARARAAG